MDNKNKKLKRAMLLPLLAVLMMSGCSKKESNEVANIQEAGVLRVAVADTDSRYTWLENGNPAGMEPELAEVFAGALGVRAEFQVKTKQEALAAVAAGEADIAMGCINNSGSLAADYLTSTPYGKGFLYGVTKKGDFALTSGSFKDSRIGVTSGLDEETRVGIYDTEGVAVDNYNSLDMAASHIVDGTIRAYICYEDQAKKLLEDSELQVQNVSNLEPEDFVVVAQKSSQTLVNGINTLIRQFLEEE